MDLLILITSQAFLRLCKLDADAAITIALYDFEIFYIDDTR